MNRIKVPNKPRLEGVGEINRLRGGHLDFSPRIPQSAVVVGDQGASIDSAGSWRREVPLSELLSESNNFDFCNTFPRLAYNRLEAKWGKVAQSQIQESFSSLGSESQSCYLDPSDAFSDLYSQMNKLLKGIAAQNLKEALELIADNQIPIAAPAKEEGTFEAVVLSHAGREIKKNTKELVRIFEILDELDAQEEIDGASCANHEKWIGLSVLKSIELLSKIESAKKIQADLKKNPRLDGLREFFKSAKGAGRNRAVKKAWYLFKEIRRANRAELIATAE